MIQIDFINKPKECIPEYFINKHGYKHLYDQNGKYHSYNDLPAIITVAGAKHWYKHGEKHRDNDLPACVYPDGTKYWYFDGYLHRNNGLPAVITLNGKKEYWFYGRKQNKFLALSKKYIYIAEYD